MSTTKRAIKIRSAKYAYLLSICRTFSNRAFITLIQEFERDATVAAKYQYEMHLRLDFANETHFALRSAGSHFLSAFGNDALNMRILGRLSTLSDAARSGIYQKYIALIGTKQTPAGGDAAVATVEHAATCGVLAPLDLVRMYESYKYVFISFILDYGQDAGYVHQCGLLVDNVVGEFLFYEPYGTYIKYGRDYARAVGEFLQIYYDELPAAFKTADGRVRCTTFHTKYGIEGIQNIILTTNNAAAAEFETRYRTALDGIAHDYPKLHAAIQAIRTSDPIYASDKTLVILDVVSLFNRWATPPGDEKYLEYWTTMLELYYDFNSKTCVSITLVELFNFFTEVRRGAEFIDLRGFTAEFKIGRPNDVLFPKLVKFIETYVAPDIESVELNIQKICSTLG